MNYYDGIKDGSEIFKNFMSRLVDMESQDRVFIFGNSSIAGILETFTADEIMARMGAIK